MNEIININIKLLNNSNEIIQDLYIIKPKTYQNLLSKLKAKFRYLPKYFITFIRKNNNEIIIKNNENYNLIRKVLFIREINYNYSEQSSFEINYNKLSESKKELLDEKYNCSICSMIIKKENPLFCYNCQKIYHEKCLKDWDKIRKLQNKKLECPTCRNILPFEKWNKKLDYEENRKIETQYIKKINTFELNNNIKIINEKKLKELKIFELFKNIINKIKTIESLINLEIDNRLNNIITELNKYNDEIKNILNIILEELEKIEYNIKNYNNESINKLERINISKKKKQDINKQKQIEDKENKNEYKNEINLIYSTKSDGINNYLEKNL